MFAPANPQAYSDNRIRDRSTHNNTFFEGAFLMMVHGNNPILDNSEHCASTATDV
jgi:hypothetical protein